MTKTQLTLAETRMKVGEAIHALHVSDHNALVNALLESGVFSGGRSSSNRELLNRGIIDQDTFYAVHTSDLDLLSSCAVVVSALPAVFTNPIPIVAALLLLLYRYRRKRARLNATQGLVLLSLMQVAPSGLTVSTIVKRVGQLLTVPTKRALKLNAAKVRAELASLKNVRLENGTATSFVSEDSGQWFAVDV